MKDKGRFAEHEARWGPLPLEVRLRYRCAHGDAIHAMISLEAYRGAKPTD
jgi:hypothetical protein